MNTINDPPGIGLRTAFHPQSSSPTPSGLLCHLCRNLGNWFVSNWISSEGPSEGPSEGDTEPTRSRSSHGCYNVYQHHISWDALSQCASQACCPFCYQLALEGEARFMGGTVAYKIQHGKSTAFTAEIQMDGGDARIMFFCDRLVWSMFDVKVMPDDPMIQHGISTLPQPSDVVDFALASTLANGKRWFEDCKTAHAECKIKSRFAPTRLLDVGSSEASKDLKLIDMRRFGIRVDTNLEYATLSHCWGRTKHITTATDTQKEREAGIAFSELNRTFQDAVLVTRALGIRYLWIDSLCIIQDSTLDWQKESSLMGSVYNGAVINIAADAAEDGDQGFLSKRALSSFPYTLIGKGYHGTLFMKASKRKRWVEYSGNLRRRAWVFQEYTLSACSIRYNLDGLVWECRCGYHYDSEVLFEENDIRRAVRDLKKLPLQIESVSPSSPTSKISEIMALWRKIVSEYSKKELTYETDVLPALSGLASLVQAATGDQYLAGIWRSDLPQALRWVPDSPDWLPSTYLAPTWSWACRKKSSPVTFLSSTEVQYKVKVLDAEVTPVGEENPFGCVSDGFLKLEGLALRCAFEQHPNFKSSSSSSAKVVIELKTQERIMVSTGFMNDHHRHLAELPPVWVFLICYCPRENAFVQDHLNIYGVLILEEDLRENVFRRLAYRNVPMTEADWDDAETKIVIVK